MSARLVPGSLPGPAAAAPEVGLSGSRPASQAVSDRLATADLTAVDIGELVAEIDRDVLPAAGRALGVSGLALSLVVGRVSARSVAAAFVAECRVHLLADDGRLEFVSRDHTVHGLYPQSAWRDKHGYTEEIAKMTILDVVGRGTANVEMHLLPRPAHGALIAVSYMWHRYADPGSYLPELQRWAAGATPVTQRRPLLLAEARPT